MSTDEAFNRGGALRLQNEFDRLFMFACTHFPQSAMFATRDDLEGQYRVYFSPDCSGFAGDLIRKWCGIPCDRPDRQGLCLLVGDANGVDRLFAE
jgi:hypothetical protein